MRSVTSHIETRFAIAVAFAALAATSCTKPATSASSPAADDNGGVTSAPAQPASTPNTVANVATQKAVVPAGAPPATTPSPAPAETPVVAPSPEVMQAVTTAQSKLDALTAVLAGTKVRYVDCSDPSACTARVEAQSLAGLRDLLSSASAQQGGIGFVAREQLDGYAGRTFVADVTLGGATTRPVPADENELLAN